MQHAEIRLRQLTVRARVALAERLGRLALSELEATHPGFVMAQQALDKVKSWQHHPGEGGAALLDALLNDREEGVFALVDARTSLPTDHVFNVIGGAVSLAAWHAFRLAGEPIPEGFEEDEQVLLQWLLDEAALCSKIGGNGVASLVARLSTTHASLDGDALGEPVHVEDDA